MKNILYSVFLIMIFASAGYSQVAPINMPEVYDNSIALPKTAEEGYNMFTDNTFTILKSPYIDKITYIKDYEKQINDYIAKTTEEVRTLTMSNDPLIRDTSQEEINRKIKNLNLEMIDIVSAELWDVGMAQVDFNKEIAVITDNKEKLKRLNAYISGKYADITNKYAAKLREKLLQIYPLY